MAVTLEELQIKFTAEMGNLNSQLNGVKGQLNGLTATTGKTQSAFSSLFLKGGLVVAAVKAGKAIIDVGAESLKMANDAVESESLFKVSMGNMEKDARDWSESLSASLGLNAYEVRKNVGMLNVMFGSMGVGEKEAYNMATGMTQLANDMASFYNLSTDEAFDKLRAGITGETEPLRRLGILVDENTVKQYAMKNGISKTGKELTQQQKLQARYGAIMEQTSKAQGDLARTMDSPVNQMRRLNAEFDTAKIALGQALQPALISVLPVLTGFARGIANVMGGGVKTSNPFSDVVISLADASASITNGVSSLSQITVEKIKTLKADVQVALEDYAKATGQTKNVVIGIQLKPQTTGYQNILDAIDGLKKYVDSVTATEIKDSVEIWLNAALEDGKVTPEEIKDVKERLKKQVEALLKAEEESRVNAHLKVKAQAEAGEITPEDADEMDRQIEEQYKTHIDGINQVYRLAVADIEVGNWNAVQLSSTDRDKIKTVIETEVNSGETLLVKAEAAVEGIFGGAGQAGQTFLDYYSGLVEEARALGEAIKKAAEEGMTKGASPEFLANLAKQRQEFLSAQKYLSEGLAEGNELNIALGNFDLNPESLKNVLDAFNKEFDKEKKAEQTIVSDQEKLASPYMFDPQFLADLKDNGYESYDAWIGELKKQSADRLKTSQESMMDNMMNVIGPALDAFIEKRDPNAYGASLDFAVAIRKMVDSIPDPSLLSEGAKEQYDALKSYLDQLEALMIFQMNPDAFQKPEGNTPKLVQPGGRAIYGDNYNLSSLDIDTPKVNITTPQLSGPSDDGSGGSFGSVAVEIGTSDVTLNIDGRTVARAVINYLPKVYAQSGKPVFNGGGGLVRNMTR